MVHFLAKTRCGGDVYFAFKFEIPTVILAEFNTHRAFSRNAASTRALDLKTYRKNVLEKPFVPENFVENSRAMFSDKKLEGIRATVARAIWKSGLYVAAGLHFLMEKLHVHKQHANRLLSPYAYTKVIASIADSYSLDNFFRLRTAPDAQPEFRKLALLIKYIYDNAPFMDVERGMIVDPLRGVYDPEKIDPAEIVTSIAQIARVSYNQETLSDFEKNLKLAKRLYSNGHRSPFEHVVVAVGDGKRYHNRVGYINLRQLVFPDEFQTIEHMIPEDIFSKVFYMRNQLIKTLTEV